MIKPSELSKISNKEGVRPQQIEKDYIISWILWGISSDEFLKKALIFKGGTCLKRYTSKIIDIQKIWILQFIQIQKRLF